MSILETDTIFTFSNLFAGHKNQFGQFKPAKEQTDVKIEGDAWSEYKPLLFEEWEAHLTGKVGLGIIPVFDDLYVNWSVIDVDVYKEETKLRTILNMIDDFGLPFIPFRSKSGGLHLYIFYSDSEGPVKAEDAIKVCKEFLTIFRLDKKTEIFPKQAVIKEGQKGNWINLPYFGGDDTTRYMLTKDLERVSLLRAVTMIMNRRYTLTQIRSVLSKLPMADGPPCLQNIFMGVTRVGPEDGRNNYLFSLGRYWKTKDVDEIEEGLRTANERLPVPLEEREIAAIVKSSETTNASYLCRREPLLAICNNALCKTREFGIEHVDISNFNFGQLTKYQSDPPYYVWEIDGQKMEFFSERALRDQKEFGYQSMRYLHRAPRMIKDYAWVKILNVAFENIKVEWVEKEDDFSLNSLLMGYTVSFMEVNAIAHSKEQVLMGCVYKDMEKRRYLFRPEEYYKYVRKTKGFTAFQVNELARKLTVLGGQAVRIYNPDTKEQFRCWALPIDSLTNYLKQSVQPVDFLARAEEEDFWRILRLL